MSGQLNARGGVDAAGGNEAGFHRLVEIFLPVGALFLAFGRGERARDAPAHIFDRAFLALGVLFEQSLAADFLVGQGRESDTLFQRFFCGHGTERFGGVFFLGYAFRRELAIRINENLQALDIDKGSTTRSCAQGGPAPRLQAIPAAWRSCPRGTRRSSA
jgi:hypothetical protein